MRGASCSAKTLRGQADVLQRNLGTRKSQANLAPTAGQVGHHPLVMAVEVVRRLLTERTPGGQGSGGHKNGEGCGLVLDPFHDEALPQGEHQRPIHERVPFRATRCDVEGEFSRKSSAYQACTKGSR
jgi:hypothetical protein